MSSQEIEDKLMLLIPEIKELIEYWKEEPISILSLTSVGLVIGAQYSHLINKKEYNLNTWI